MGYLHIIGWVFAALIALVALFFLFWRLYFLRMPWREIPWKGMVSPANGKVVRIIKFDGKGANVDKGLLGKVKVWTKDVAKKGHIVVIMMTPMDVHYQRAPVEGKVLEVRYSKGKFLNAVAGAEGLKASIENEKNEMLIQWGKKRLKVIQVAGFVARRIECYVKKNEKIHKGQILGRINLGSQVIMVMPEGKLAVKEGQKVIDGETIIMR